MKPYPPKIWNTATELAERFASGTRHSVNDSPQVSEAFQPTFEYFGATAKPAQLDLLIEAELEAQ